MKKLYRILFPSLLLIFSDFLSSCSSYSTDLNQMEKIKISQMADIITGQSCTNNLFGGFTLPYIGDTAIKLSGDQSVIAAIKNANITSVYAVDKLTKSYVFYSRRCTIVFGKKDAIASSSISPKDATVPTVISVENKDTSTTDKKNTPAVKILYKRVTTPDATSEKKDETPEEVAPTKKEAPPSTNGAPTMVPIKTP